MPETIDQETRSAAAAMWIEDGLTYETVAARTGVSVGALKKWAAEEDWPAARQQHRQALADIRANTQRLRRALIEKALASLHPQDVYAVTSLETMLSRAEHGRGGGAAPVAITREIRTTRDAIEALQAAVERRVNAMLAGDVRLSEVREMKQALDLIDKMRRQYAPDDDAGHQVLSENRIREIKEQLAL